MAHFGATPEEVLIVEDSGVGKPAAREAGAFVRAVRNCSEVNYYRVTKALAKAESVNVLIPAAGQGKRFLKGGVHYPKPLIPLRDVPMIALVLSNMPALGSPIELLQKNRCEIYCADKVIKKLEPRSRGI